MINFAPLHIRTGFSFLKSGLTIKKVQKAILEHQYFGAGITDLNVLFGLPNFASAMKDLNKPFILGVDVEVEEITYSIFIKNEEGYKNIIKISNLIQKNPLTHSQLEEYADGLIVVLNTNSELFKKQFLSRETDQTFAKYLFNLSRAFQDDFYLGLDITSKEEVTYANALRTFIEKYPYTLVAFPLVLYPKKEDAITLKIVEAIDTNTNIEIKQLSGPQHFYSLEDYQKIYKTNELEETLNILKKVDFDIASKRGKVLSGVFTNADEELKKTCYQKLNSIDGIDKNLYSSRLEYELETIKEMGFSSYFMTVQDYVKYAKENDILVAPGRGSSAGSLVSYLLNITEADPIHYDLQFERFLNKDRQTMPDIDVDFMDTRRDEVVDYLRSKYGKNKVANIIAFQTIQAKQALRDIGRVYNIKEEHISLLSKRLTGKNLTLGQSYKNISEFKELVDSDDYFKNIVSLAGKIEGLPRQSGQHAAGVVLNNEPLDEVMPTITDFEGNLITQYEAEFLEQQHFLKMDILSLRNLTTISYCVNLINSRYPNTNLDPKNIPFDDPDVYRILREKNTIGIFQVETVEMRRGLGIIKPKTFNDVVALLALNRPGPMAFMKNYANRRDGKEKYSFISKDFEDILGSTYGIIVYQEQVNKLAQKIAGFTPNQADTFRRAISKKDITKMNKMKPSFYEGCLKNGYTQKQTDDLYKTILKFANYGFNKSHSVVYAIVACRMAYLKAKYPTEFYLSILQTGTTSTTKFSEYISEMKRMGIIVLPPDVNKSFDRFVPVTGGIVFPLNSISYIDTQTTNLIVQEREQNGRYKDFFDFVCRMYALKISENQIIKLINAGALDSLYPSRESMRSTLKSALQFAELNYTADGQMALGISSITPPSMIVEKDDPMNDLNLEFEVLGIVLSSNPLKINEQKLINLNITPIVDLYDQTNVTIGVVISNKKIIRTKKSETMAFIKVFDESGELEITIFPKLYEKAAAYLELNKIILVKGHLETRNDENNFVADEVKPLEE